MGARLEVVGRLLADATRAGVLVALLDGRARTGGELARHLHVAPSTISEHLGKLLDAGFVRVDAQGRHRYWRLASPTIAELLETIGATAPSTTLPRANAPAALIVARSCYDHLAGALAVATYDRLIADDHLAEDRDHLEITPRGIERLASLGVDASALIATRRPIARSCLDWTERTYHLGGAAGAALFETFQAKRWLRRGTRPRHVEITDTGRRAFARHFGWRDESRLGAD
jgi:DNA-binding transcriptional ArsR family regulator